VRERVGSRKYVGPAAMPGLVSLLPRESDVVDDLTSVDGDSRLKALRAVKNQIIGALLSHFPPAPASSGACRNPQLSYGSARGGSVVCVGMRSIDRF
jgi:hypothetical protein